ncbi:uncharacterized protein LOC113469276 [Diaphorina citri]|uniref:Uncharacterized protein LOC113469276 n=1 Tax=Diaphorina citri TaxID=121845 RepID=A0A3Q0J6R6_DIACI|nr:uncharacterized protein LOC113469276 [Diaphorina citri]
MRARRLEVKGWDVEGTLCTRSPTIGNRLERAIPSRIYGCRQSTQCLSLQAIVLPLCPSLPRPDLYLRHCSFLPRLRNTMPPLKYATRVRPPLALPLLRPPDLPVASLDGAPHPTREGHPKGPRRGPQGSHPDLWNRSIWHHCRVFRLSYSDLWTEWGKVNSLSWSCVR